MDTTPTKKPLSSHIFTVIKLVAVAVVIWFFYYKFKGNWAEVTQYDWEIHYPLLILSILFQLFVFLLFSKVWCYIIEAFGHKVKLRHAYKIGYITNLARYIPGKIWPVFGMAYLAKQLDIPEEKSVTSWVIAMVFTLPSAFMVSIVTMFVYPDVFQESVTSYLGVGFYLLAGAMFVGSLLLVLFPNKLFYLFNIILKKINRPLISFEIDLSTALIVFFGYAVCWIGYGISFWLLTKALLFEIPLPLIPVIGAFVLAYQVGYLAFFSPGGIGVRELILTLILTPLVGPIAVGVVIAARIWNMIIELCAALIAYVVKMPGGNRL